LSKEIDMRPITRACLLGIATALLISAPLPSQTEKPHPFTLPLACALGDCPILKGALQTGGMRSGFVRLKTGETVGWHTTGMNEEALVVLHGEGKVLIDDRSGGQPGLSFVAPALVYIPPATRHNVENTGKDPLEYEYVVAPAKEQ
jgi:mannose-6-phosphate isomerase-like protein (cupin superfamily)